MSAVRRAPLLMRVVSASVAVAGKAQKVIRNIMKAGDLAIVDKGVNDLQTAADRTAQLSIVTTLRRHFPHIHINGEEDLALSDFDNVDASLIEQNFDQTVFQHGCPQQLKNVTDDEIVVWVDPLDGTREFTQGLLDHVTVLIGIAVNGVATAGVIAQPYYNYQSATQPLGRVMWGVVGLGIFGVTARRPPAGENIITMTRSHSDSIVVDAVNACQPTRTLAVGGCGHKVLLVLEGQAHAYIFASQGCKKWDTCAPEAILRACGGQLTDLHGHAYRYHSNATRPNTGGVLATLDNHDWYIQHIPRHVLKALPTQKS